MAKGVKTELDRRDKDMLNYYKNLCAKKTAKGKTELSMDAIIEKVAFRFYLSERYVETHLKKLLTEKK